ncbi:unnamed protein product (macronuclear) [Paramecium tetraurelia]|uniref:Uncharacterized protein n=1 Tax=Paramecium tetraurelia TaxID=5888 RepID=A0BJG9_PARTE|nr:uncharacterized protein GSPATT00029313001 [Paramecium tetraurelia]CAK58686.1 unnamed protein product [Paramecium tetraurelia]|eukprot:XP_001426084.1 hypothetical protein (macronuclear) [Paramecium tetraurelia strain d4-2]
MFQSYVIDRKFKTESSKVVQNVRFTKVFQRGNEHKNYSFEIPNDYDQLPKKLRCQSTYSNLCGCRSHKYQFFHDIISEFAEHKKQRLANVIIQNLRFTEKSTLPSQGSARNIFSKGGPSLNHNYSQFMKKVKDFKIAEQNIIAQTPRYSFTFETSSIQECMPLTRQPSFEQVLDAKQTLTPSYSRNQSPKLLFSILLPKISEPQQFILKSKFKTNNALDKILTEARNQITTSQSPRSVQVSQHKKIKSHPAKVYTEHNRLLQRVILKTKLNQ